MSRYIDADKITISAEHGICEDGLIFIPMPDVQRSIDQTPTVDVAKVRHGEWINSGFCNSLKNCMLIKCSECDFGHFIHPYLMDYDGVLTFGEFKLNTHYCQNCGAKMDGERRAEE